MEVDLFINRTPLDDIYMGINPKGQLVVIFVDRQNKSKTGRRVSSMFTCNNPECSGFCVSINLEDGLIDNPEDI